jgi:hypothetical protein
MAGNYKENTMKTKHGLLFGFALIALAAIFTFAGCPTEDDDGGGGGGPKITISGTPQVGQTLTATPTGVTIAIYNWWASDDPNTNTDDDDNTCWKNFGSTTTIELTEHELGKYIYLQGMLSQLADADAIYSNVLGPVTAAGGNPGTGAALTITGLAAHNGKYAVAHDNTSSEISGVYQLIAAASSMSNNSSVTGVKIENGQAVLKVFNYQGGGDPTLSYTGSDQNISLRVFVKDSNSFDVKGTGTGTDIGSVTVNFSSGSGTAVLVK